MENYDKVIKEFNDRKMGWLMSYFDVYSQSTRYYIDMKHVKEALFNSYKERIGKKKFLKTYGIAGITIRTGNGKIIEYKVIE